MKFAINQATTMKSDFVSDIKAYAKASFEAVEIWLPKLYEFLKGATLDEAKKLLKENGIKPVCACFHGDLMLSEGEKRKKVIEQFNEKLKICNALEIPFLVVVGDFPSEVNEKSYEIASENLFEAGNIAEKYGVGLAVEFIAGANFIGCLSTAKLIVEKTNHKNVGILFDTFHFYRGISKMEDIDNVNGEKIFFVHINDVANKPREILTDKDRVLPGEGIMPLKEIVKRLKKIKYDGYYSLELFNEKLWELDPFTASKKCFDNINKFKEEL
jgi:sugar phosphate isomerase/epimerase